MNVNLVNLAYLAEEFLEKQDEKTEEKLMKEIVETIIQDKDILIDGEMMDDGSVDPSHIQVDIDENRFYFHVYTSKQLFDSCGGKNAYVLKLKDLLEPIFNEDTFGGITLNYRKGENMVLISKENIYSHLNSILQ